MTITRRGLLQSLGAGAVLYAARRSAAQGPDGAGAASVQQRRIPKSGELIPCVGMGTSRTFDADPRVDLSALADVMRAFLAAGGTVIDSSPMYGRSEEVVGRVLERVEHGDLFYATKVWTDDGRAAGERQMRESMRLMGADVMDLMQVHNLVGLRDHLPTLREWKAAGVFRYIGVTEMRDLPTVERLMREDGLDFIQIPYSVEEREVEARILPAARDTGTAVLVMRPFGRGRLFERVRGKSLPEWAAEFDCRSWAQFFLKFILGHEAVTCPIPATSKRHHMVDNMRAGVGPFPDEATRTRMVRELDL